MSALVGLNKGGDALKYLRFSILRTGSNEQLYHTPIFASYLMEHFLSQASNGFQDPAKETRRLVALPVENIPVWYTRTYISHLQLGPRGKGLA